MNIIQNELKHIPQPRYIPSMTQIDPPESIVRSFNAKNSRAAPPKTNNNSLPNIETDLIRSINPQVSHQIPVSFSTGLNQRKNNLIMPRAKSEPKPQVSFSYGKNTGSAFRPQRPQNMGMNIVTRINNFQPMGQSNSLQNLRNFSNLSELSRNKTNYQQPLINPFVSFQRPNQPPKVIKLGKKYKTVKFSQQSNPSSKRDNFMTSSKQNESLQVIQSPKKNISSISIEKSQYVFVTNSNQKDRIVIGQQEYWLSQNNISPKNPFIQPKVQNSIKQQVENTIQNNSIILPIEEEEYSQIHPETHKQSINRKSKSPQKIDNKVYLEEKPQNAKQLRKIQDKESKVSNREDLNKFSKISRIDIKIDQQPQSRDFLNFNEQPKLPSPFKQIKKDTQQKQQLLRKIQQLQQRLKQKQAQNINLQQRLQNAEIQKHLKSEYEKLQIQTKLNQVEIKKLQNQIKMFKIKEKMFLNTQKQHIFQINSLKSELNSLKKPGTTSMVSPIFRKKEKYEAV